MIASASNPDAIGSRAAENPSLAGLIAAYRALMGR
jgi:hypothetical protein